MCAKRGRECTRPGTCLSRGSHRAFSGPQQDTGKECALFLFPYSERGHWKNVWHMKSKLLHPAVALVAVDGRARSPSAPRGRAALVAAMITIAITALADNPTISVSARQRYPWNGLVDVHFTITGDAGTKYETSFTAKDMVGNTNIAMRTIRKADGTAAATKEPLLPGTYSWVWDAAADLPKDFKCDRVTVTGMAAESVEKTYMVVNLTSGSVTYLDSVPSGGWENTHKSTLMVLRKVPASGSVKEFYIGIFEITQAQWTKLGMSNDSSHKSSYYPAEHMSGWEVREYVAKMRTLTKMGYFCFPSEAQWLVAANYGAGGFKTGDTEYTVGSLSANTLGVYDLKGNVEEWIRSLKGNNGSYASSYGAIGSYYGANSTELNQWKNSGNRGPTAASSNMGARIAYSTTDYKSVNGSGGAD